MSLFVEGDGGSEGRGKGERWRVKRERRNGGTGE